MDMQRGGLVKGTGRAPVGTQPIQQIALAEFRKKAIDDIEEAYRELRAGMRGEKNGDRYHKIFWETLVGKVTETRDTGLSEAMKALVEAATRTAPSTIVHEHVYEVKE
jgi:hypothetical protein